MPINCEKHLRTHEAMAKTIIEACDKAIAVFYAFSTAWTNATISSGGNCAVGSLESEVNDAD